MKRAPVDRIARVKGLAVCCITKNGNTSIKRALLRAQGIEPTGYIHHHPALNMGRDCTGLFLVAFLRHPVSRLYSCWANKIRVRDGRATEHFERIGFTVGMDFRDFAALAIHRQPNDIHLQPQSAFLPREPDFVGRARCLTEEWETLRERFDWLPVIEHVNASHAGAWRDHCDYPTRLLIEAGYASDLELYRRYCGYDAD